ncbi:mycolic acid cyclopropane synthetase family protein, partial [Mycobacterium tuberculosis variant bovis]
RSIGVEHILPIAPPPQEARPRWRRMANGLLHSKTRDAEAIHHHYDVSNNFYEWVLGPSMTYTCAVFPNAEASLEQAQENKYRLIFEKLSHQADQAFAEPNSNQEAQARTNQPGNEGFRHYQPK